MRMLIAFLVFATALSAQRGGGMGGGMRGGAIGGGMRGGGYRGGSPGHWSGGAGFIRGPGGGGYVRGPGGGGFVWGGGYNHGFGYRGGFYRYNSVTVPTMARDSTTAPVTILTSVHIHIHIGATQVTIRTIPITLIPLIQR